MKKQLLICMAILGSMQFASAGDPVDVTSTYLSNYSAPFIATGEALIPRTIGSGERFQKLAEPWVIENGVGTMGVDYTSWYVDFDKCPHYPTYEGSRMGAFTITPGWDGFASLLTNIKAYQTTAIPLEAGSYEFEALQADQWDGGAYLVAAKGTGIPNVADLSTALASAKTSTIDADHLVTISFILTEPTIVSLGVVASYPATAKTCVSIASFKLSQIIGTNYKPLKALLVKAKAYTPAQYPIGTISGTYSQAKWDALQATILDVDAFIAAGEADTQANVDAKLAALQAAMNDLNGSMVLPFKLSDAANPVWYQIRDMRAASDYWTVGQYTTASTTYPIALTITQTGDNTLDEQLFRFEKAPSPSKGFYIYNKLIENVALTAVRDSNIVLLSADSIPSAFQLGKTVSASHFIVFKEGDVANQLNSYVDAKRIAFWNPGANNDPGNDWEFVELLNVGQTDFSALKALTVSSLTMVATAYPSGTELFQYSQPMWDAFVVARTAAIDLVAKEGAKPQETQETVDAMVVALQTAIDNLKGSKNLPITLSTPEKEYYYTVSDKRGNTSYWYVADQLVDDGAGNMVVSNAKRLLFSNTLYSEPDSSAFQFKFVKEAGSFLIYCKKYPETALSVSATDGNIIHVDAAAANAKWTLGTTPVSDTDYFTITLDGTTKQMNSFDGRFTMGFWSPANDDPGNDWKFTSTLAVQNGIKQVSETDLGVSVINHRIICKDAASKLNVHTVLGQKVDAKFELSSGIYLVQVVGIQGVAKVIVK